MGFWAEAVGMPHLFLTNTVKFGAEIYQPIKKQRRYSLRKSHLWNAKRQVEGQTFYLIFDIQYADAKQGVVTKTVRFIGRKVWIDTYKWGRWGSSACKIILAGAKVFLLCGSSEKPSAKKIKYFCKSLVPHFE